MRHRLLILSTVLAMAAPTAAQSASHLWVINEIFSNADGSIQFVEMHVPSNNANETNLTNKWVDGVGSGNQFTFTENLPAGSTAFAYLLLATADFASLPGAPTPDYVLPDNFLDLDADTVRWWLYGSGDLTYASGELPLDGVNSFNRGVGSATNSPTNFNGESGSIDANTTAVEEQDGETPFFFHAIYGDGDIRLEFRAPGAGTAKVDIYDVSGRIIRRVFEGSAEQATSVTWDGHNDQGENVASGVYFARFEAGPHLAVRKLTNVK